MLVPVINEEISLYNNNSIIFVNYLIELLELYYLSEDVF